MKKMLLVSIAAGVLIGTTAVSGFGCGNQPVKIGVIISLSGAGQEVGADVRDGMMMAVREINQNDGVDGRMLELVFRDTGSSGERAAEVFNELETEIKPDLYITQHSVNSMAVAPLAEEHEVVLIGLVTSTPEFTQDKAWVYRYYSTAKADIDATMQTLDELNVDNLGILYLDESFGQSFYELLAGQFRQTGGTVVAEPFGMNPEQYMTHVQKVIDEEAVYIVGYATHISVLLEELRIQKFQGDILTNSSSSSPVIVAMPEAEGIFITSARIYSSEYPIGEQVKLEFEQTYHRQFNHYSANGYDSIKLLADLIAGNNVSREGIRKLLDAGFIHPGVLGTIYIEADNHEITFPLYPASIQDKKIVFRY